MAATFHSVILGQPEIATMVFAFQFGLYEDVCPAFRACRELVELVARFRSYACDPSFRQAFAPNAVWSDDLGYITPLMYALRGNQRDPRLPLHVAIAQGFVPLTKRILCCRPDLVSDDAIVLAFEKNHLAIVELLLDQRESLARHLNYWGNMVARDDSRGLLLLQRFGLHPDDVIASGRRYVINRATLKNATLALDLFPWLLYPSLLDDIAGKGFLPLVRSLHERGLDCSTVAMNEAATNGHLEVVKFLHFNRTEGCTIGALEWAILNGHLDVVRFLIAHRTEGASPTVLDFAAANGHFDVVQHLHSLGTFGCTVAAVDHAASGGHLNIVEFLLMHRSEGCTHDKVVEKALKGCHPHMARYLLSRGYPFPTSELNLDYFCFGNPESVGVFELLVAHGRPIEEDWFLQACVDSNLPLVRLLYAYADPAWHPEALKEAVRVNAWDIVRFLLANDAMDVSADTLKKALRSGYFDLAAQILRRQPELRHEKLLEAAAASHNAKAIRLLLAAGIGNPREVLLEIAGRKQHVTDCKLLLPCCMDATDHLDNISFLLDLLALPDRHRATTLQLITSELLEQGRKASQTMQLAPSAAARASNLLQAGEVVDWALALVMGHLRATATIEELEKKTALVEDAELKTQLQRLLEEKP
ncbi:hypothetical protein SDRG_08585 [Saprolegnia diclina VS20]|uniref:Uncharacterized protein n=1 Tax=Saprolegnia diclina (strain VS20) TaxID=1156394 RepID=T0QJI1_SAPDV|nr:hypothetical protein SDRG_08585 [Saprolegnia diclina VS20]EQC33905.1 hypothetical protein SDRG_08585 [Saprolegnia diclina VS20]|eukprot:XP_008612700.1 hypothetical protein SDRG_08585 [Saprolegnia diclina VS20]